MYSPQKLWLAYGLAALFTCIATVVGLFAIFTNGASYTNNFSTILRATRKAHITEELQLADLSSQDPLPTHLRKATITLGLAKPFVHQSIEFTKSAQSVVSSNDTE